MKRPSSPPRGDISPPSVKRKIESTTTSKAVATFFKPASQKEPEKVAWRIIDHSLVIGRYEAAIIPPQSRNQPVKVAAFDLDDTIISPIGNRWTRSATSWKWWNASVPGRLKALYEEGYLVTIFSNQGNISLKDNPKVLQKDTLGLVNLKSQVASILKQLDFPVSIYAATGQDRYRKPRVGMWEEFLEDYDLQGQTAVDLERSFYIGDAAGREKTDKRRKDHASSDRDLAANIGIGFWTPEEFFLDAETEPYERSFEPVRFLETLKTAQAKASVPTPFTKKNVQDLVIFCGSPGSGKSTFYWEVLQPFGYERVNQDILKTRDRCIKAARDYLRSGSSVAVDNTNADIETRKYWVQIARDFKIPIRCVRFTAPTRLCEHNDSVRALNRDLMNPEGRSMLPGIAFRSFLQRFIEPTVSEGFQDITKVDFDFKGTPEQQQVWSRYWVSKFST